MGLSGLKANRSKYNRYNLDGEQISEISYTADKGIQQNKDRLFEGCDECYFDTKGYCFRESGVGECVNHLREDGNGIIFMEVK